MNTLKSIFNRYTAIPAIFTIGMGVLTVGAVDQLISHPTMMTGAWAALSATFTAVNANSWKARVDGKPFFNFY